MGTGVGGGLESQMKIYLLIYLFMTQKASFHALVHSTNAHMACARTARDKG